MKSSFLLVFLFLISSCENPKLNRGFPDALKRCGPGEEIDPCPPPLNKLPKPVPVNDSSESESSPKDSDFVDSVLAHGYLSVLNGQIVDQFNFPVQLKGMSLFWGNWSREFWTKENVRYLVKDWKSSVIRAAVAVEVDGGYVSKPDLNFAQLETVIDAAIEQDVYVIVDWHTHDAPRFERQAIEFFQRVISKYPNTPNLIFEIYNEPIGEPWSVIKAYSERVIGAIRAAGAQNLIIAGSGRWSTDLESVMRDPIRMENVAYSFHFYAGSHRQPLRSVLEKAVREQLPVFVTEFGLCQANGNGALDLVEADRWFDLMNQNKISWVNWSFFNKPESCSALLPQSGTEPPYADRVISASGKIIRDKIRY